MALGSRRLGAATLQAPLRGAIYTRKSTAEGLNSDFTTLDNQRQAAEAFIASQQHEGWTALANRYDDGGFSGGTADRPALKRLLADVEAGQVQAVVVYKLDRLSRSLVDFGRIHEFLEGKGVALVSVTESINTNSPHGRMMVNVLLSFAQYERELVAERTRDKMSAARRRGKWTGGMPPLGYDVAPEGGKIVVNRDEAARVLAIFELYRELQSLIRTSQALNQRGWCRKSWTTKRGTLRKGKPWDKISLRRTLTDAIYAGKQKLRGETFSGEHAAVVPKALFREVQRILRENRSRSGDGIRRRSGLLTGLLRCTPCDATMVFTPKTKNGKSYGYYTCTAAMKNGRETCPTRSVSADSLEGSLLARLGGMLAEGRETGVADDLGELWSVLAQPTRRDLVLSVVSRLDYDGSTREVTASFRPEGVAELAKSMGEGSSLR